MNPWTPTLLSIGASVGIVAIGWILTYGKMQARQEDHARRIGDLEKNQVSKDELKTLRELFEVKFEGLQNLVIAKLDAMMTMMNERRSNVVHFSGKERRHDPTE